MSYWHRIMSWIPATKVSQALTGIWSQMIQIACAWKPSCQRTIVIHDKLYMWCCLLVDLCMAKELLHRFPSGPKPTTFHEEAVQRHSADCAAISTTFLKKKTACCEGLMESGLEAVTLTTQAGSDWHLQNLSRGPIYFALQCIIFHNIPDLLLTLQLNSLCFRSFVAQIGSQFFRNSNIMGCNHGKQAG